MISRSTHLAGIVTTIAAIMGIMGKVCFMSGLISDGEQVEFLLTLPGYKKGRKFSL